VHTPEPLEHGTREVGLYASVMRVKHHDPVPIIGNENPAVLMDLQAVGLTVVLNDLVKFALRIYAEYPPIGDVDAIKIAISVERRTLEEGRQLAALMLLLQPIGLARIAFEFLGQSGKNARGCFRWGSEHGCTLTRLYGSG